ncbi:MAG: carboxypeptidase-like regulatory domain-containing protein [Candidatus Kapabacteria bacterium]|nr:carboxypeptidase-like regulatory domain-containing protein [Candidatus Kapabacteria bacterium]
MCSRLGMQRLGMQRLGMQRPMSVLTLPFPQMRSWLLAALCAIASHTIARALPTVAEDVMVIGRVVRAEDGSPIAGATVRVVNTKRGTFTARDGTFRLKVPSTPARLMARSVGCADDTLRYTPGDSAVTFRLASSPTLMNSVVVQAPINADEVMRRAIARKDSNAAKINTLTTEIFSRNVFQDYVDFGFRADTTPMVHEYVATRYDRRSPNKQNLFDVHHRHYSKNFTTEGHLPAYTFEDLRVDTIWYDRFSPLLSPLAGNAVDYYRYTLVDRRAYGDQVVYVIDFEPRIRISAAFEGRIHVLEGTYDVIYQYTRLTDETFVPFLDSASVEQHYEEVEDGIWLPVRGVRRRVHSFGMVFGAVKARGTATNFVEAVRYRINAPIADSVFAPRSSPDGKRRGFNMIDGLWVDGGMRGNKLRIWIRPEADSSRPINVDSLGVTPMTAEEAQLKALADTKPLSRPSRDVDPYELHAQLNEQQQRLEETKRRLQTVESDPFTLYSVRLGSALLSVTPSLGRTTITGFLVGAGVQADVQALRMRAEATVGETRDLYGRVGAWWTLPVGNGRRVELGGGVLHGVRTVQNEPLSVSTALNTGNLLFGLQRDYYVATGYQLGATYRGGALSASLEHESLLHSARSRYAAVSFPEPPIAAGRYALGHLRMSYADPTPLSLIDGYQALPVTGGLGLTVGRHADRATPFAVASATVTTRLNTFTLASRPMYLRTALRAAVASSDAPPQYLFYSTPRFWATGDFADLLTIPLNGYGGDRQLQVVAEHNMSDLLWRALGLPLFRRRGIDLVVSYAAAQFYQRASSPLQGAVPASSGWYQEAGIGLDAIPTLIMDHLYLRFDMRWPVGHLRRQGSSYGWSIGITSPLFREQ